MKTTIELKHVGPRQRVQGLLEELISRLEERLKHFRSDALSVHVMFEENRRHTLFHAKVTCHIPQHVIAAHEEDRDPGAAIRKAFTELSRRLERRLAKYRPQQLRRGLRRSQARALRSPAPAFKQEGA